jgi:ABC-2 type transport system ATP-binding protein
MITTYLHFRSIEKRYGPVRALAAIDLPMERGNILALLGPNGAGKTTLFGCLLGLVRPTGGEIELRGKSITDADRRSFGYLAERVALYPQRTVLENGLFFARLKNQPPAEVESQLKRVGLYAVQDRPVRQLSKGMLQRLGLAIALCGQPELLVLDEPFNGLDPALLDDLQSILRAEHARGATLLISTHTMSAIEPLATHVAILLEGRLAVHSPLKALSAQFEGEGSLEAIYHRIARQQQPVGNLDEVLA